MSAADHGRVRAEARAPERFAQDHDIGALAVVGGKKRAAGNRLDAEHVEESGRDPLARNGLGRAVRTAHDHAANAWNEPGDQIERAIPLVPVEEVERRHAVPERRRRFVPTTITRRSGSWKGSGRSRIASTSAKMALLAPMPSASVLTAMNVKAGEPSQLPNGELHVVAELFEPVGEAHFPSLTAMTPRRFAAYGVGRLRLLTL